MKNEVKHTAHSSYRCEYHVVFAPKYRRKIIYKELRKDIIEIFKKLCNEMKIEIIEGEACPDHIHLLVTIPPYMSVAQFVGTLKSKSALMLFDRHVNLKYKYGRRNFWCRGYYVDAVGKNAKPKCKEGAAPGQLLPFISQSVHPESSSPSAPSSPRYPYSVSE